MKPATPCPECTSDRVYETTNEIWAGSPGGVDDLLPGLGGLLTGAKLTVLICAECGRMRLFASEEACAQLPTSRSWARVKVDPSG